MKYGLVFILSLSLAACTTSNKRQENEDYDSDPWSSTTFKLPPATPKAPPVVALQDRLGMRRSAQDLGFAEKAFKNCGEGGFCRPQYFSVIHFQLLCRDSEGTVSSMPIHLTPLTSDQVTWSLGGLNGNTRTDVQGFGQFTLVSDKSTRGQRLILRIGKQFMGFTVSEVSKVVLPQNFCI